MLAYKGSKYQLFIKKELFICLSVHIEVARYNLLFPQPPKQKKLENI